MNKRQAYYWSPKWQAAEREADEDIAAGRVQSFDNVDDAVAHLRISRVATQYRQFGSAKALITMADDFDAPLADFSEYTEEGKVSQPYTTHEPNEELLSEEEAFRDADRSGIRWQAFERDRRFRRAMTDPSESISHDAVKSDK
jgi:hypothetical protein